MFGVAIYFLSSITPAAEWPRKALGIRERRNAADPKLASFGGTAAFLISSAPTHPDLRATLRAMVAECDTALKNNDISGVPRN